MQDRLFRLAPEAIVSTIVFVPGQGWRVSIRVRRGDETWAEAYTVAHDHLTTPEMLEALTEELAHQLGLA